MANMQDLRYLAQRTEPAVRIEEELYDHKVWIVCHACGQKLTEVPREVLIGIPRHSLPDFFKMVVEEAMERHACPVRIMALAERLPYSAGEIANGVNAAMSQSGRSAAHALRSFEDSIARLNAVASVPVPCVRCGMATAPGDVFCGACLKLEEKKGLQRLKEETASKMQKVKSARIRVIRFEED